MDFYLQRIYVSGPEEQDGVAWHNLARRGIISLA